MLKDHFISQMKLSLGFTPTSGQEQLMCQLADFVLSQQPRSVFLLSGYAGTGKTSVMSALVKT
jgi:exodeoxyribonuclease-5